MFLPCATCAIRSWHPDDRDDLVRLADNRAIWRNLRDSFPHPYTAEAAESWIREALEASPETHFAIEADGGLVGGIGITPKADIYRRSAEIGYWIGEPYWGKGYASEALSALASWGFETLQLERLYALVFAWNPASARVLEKAGFQLEGRLRKAAIKEGVVVDELLYARVRG